MAFFYVFFPLLPMILIILMGFVLVYTIALFLADPERRYQKRRKRKAEFDASHR